MSISQGQALRDAGLERLEGGPKTSQEIKASVTRIFLALLLEDPGDGVGFDEAREQLGDLPDGFKTSAFGGIPASLSRAGIIERAGYRPSRIASNHAHVYAIWKIKDRDAAEAKLASLEHEAMGAQADDGD